MYATVGQYGFSDNKPESINQSEYKAKLAAAIKGKKPLPHGAKKS
jgi:hypothetical protein